MYETKLMPNLIEANCGSCVYCQRIYYEDFMQVFLLAPTTGKLVLGRCIRRIPNLLVTLVSSCKKWKGTEK